MSSLFRHEVLENRQRDWLGSIQLTRPLSLHVLTGLALASAVAVLTYLTLGEYTRKARVTGVLVPDKGVIRLMAPRTATVLEAHVAEGRMVHQGDTLYVLSVERSTLAGDTEAAVQQTLAARERSLQGASQEQLLLERERLAGVDRQVDAMRDELTQIDAEAQLQDQRLALAQQAQARLESLRGENFISSAQLQTKAEELLGLRAQIQALQRQRAAHQREIEQLQARRREIPLQARAQRGEIDRSMAELAQQSAEAEARRRVVVRAPQDGMVTGVLAQAGQAVSPATALATLLPSNARLQAHLFAPSSAVGFVRAEQPVLLRYQAFPHQKFGQQAGQVVQVSRSPLQPAELAGLAQPPVGAAAGEALYRITVALDRQTVAAYGNAQALVPGMQLEADVMLDRRRLIEWIFEPVLGLAGRV
jgi:membrane fusion protein